jgi:hypothetical protein
LFTKLLEQDRQYISVLRTTLEPWTFVTDPWYEDELDVIRAERPIFVSKIQTPCVETSILNEEKTYEFILNSFYDGYIHNFGAPKFTLVAGEYY